MIDKYQQKLIEEICKKNPRLISIYGSTNPTYSTSSFNYNLVDYGDYLLQFSSTKYGFGCKLKKVKKNKQKWIIDIMKYFKKYHDYEIFKVKGTYLITSPPLDIENDIFYDNGGKCFVDYGGYIKIV